MRFHREGALRVAHSPRAGVAVALAAAAIMLVGASSATADADTGLQITLTVPTGFVPLGSPAAIEAVVTDSAGVPAAGQSVAVQVPGTSTTCTTEDDGWCSVSIPSRPVCGRWFLFGFVDLNGSGGYDEPEPRADGPWVVWQPSVAAVTITSSTTALPAYTNPFDRPTATFVDKWLRTCRGPQFRERRSRRSSTAPPAAAAATASPVRTSKAGARSTSAPTRSQAPESWSALASTRTPTTPSAKTSTRARLHRASCGRFLHRPPGAPLAVVSARTATIRRLSPSRSTP